MLKSILELFVQMHNRLIMKLNLKLLSVVHIFELDF